MNVNTSPVQETSYDFRNGGRAGGNQNIGGLPYVSYGNFAESFSCAVLVREVLVRTAGSIAE